MSTPSGNMSEGTLLSDDRFLRQVAHLYYDIGETQEKIAEMVYCSRQTVGKALQKARDKGIVRISVVPEERMGYLQNLARDLRLKLRLDDLVLVPGSNLEAMEVPNIAEGVLADIATRASDYLDQLLTNDMILAVSGGKNIRNVVRYLKPTKVLSSLQVVSTMGFIRPQTNFGDPNLIAYDIAVAYGAKHDWLPIPAIVETQEQCEQAQNLPLVRDVLKKLEKANVIMMSLWSSREDSRLVEKRILSQQQVDVLRTQNYVVDINHWAFDANGICINQTITPPPYYLTGLEIPRLNERIRNRQAKVILVAGASASYVPGILAVLKAGLANIFITDHVTAELLLQSSLIG